MNAFDDAAYNMAAVSATVALYRALVKKGVLAREEAVQILLDDRAQSISRSISFWVRYRRDRPCRTVKFTVVGAVALDAGNIERISLFSWLTMQLLPFYCTVVNDYLISPAVLLRFGVIRLPGQAERIKAICGCCFPA
jgi:hypothetical protein